MTTKILARTDALGNLVRFVLLPGQRFDTAGAAPLIDGLEFGALIADTAFDNNDIIADLHNRGAEIVISQHPRRTVPLQIDTAMYKGAPSDRELLLQAQGVQAHRPARRQDRSELRSDDPSCRRRHQFTLNLNGAYITPEQADWKTA
jgi:transposase